VVVFVVSPAPLLPAPLLLDAPHPTKNTIEPIRTPDPIILLNANFFILSSLQKCFLNWVQLGSVSGKQGRLRGLSDFNLVL
jgi:predicted cobalt transporter CbtA